jgi:DNA polymerase alpha subunit B
MHPLPQSFLLTFICVLIVCNIHFVCSVSMRFDSIRRNHTETSTHYCTPRYPQPPLQDRLPTGGKLLRDVGGAEGIEFGTLGLYRITSTQTQQQRGGQKSSTGMGNQPSNATNSRRVHCLSNPCTFQINELVFGVTSTDVLFHISAEETNANLPAGSRLRRIAQHMIQQGSYYPLFPPNKSVNLDLKQQRGWTMPCRPDVMIVPSKLTPFCAPVLESTIVINPGHLTRGMTGGTYATMEIAPVGNDRLSANHNDDDVQNKSVEDGVMQEVQLTHNVQDRIKVQVKRI